MILERLRFYKSLITIREIIIFVSILILFWKNCEFSPIPKIQRSQFTSTLFKCIIEEYFYPYSLTPKFLSRCSFSGSVITHLGRSGCNSMARCFFWSRCHLITLREAGGPPSRITYTKNWTATKSSSKDWIFFESYCEGKEEWDPKKPYLSCYFKEALSIFSQNEWVLLSSQKHFPWFKRSGSLLLLSTSCWHSGRIIYHNCMDSSYHYLAIVPYTETQGWLSRMSSGFF